MNRIRIHDLSQIFDGKHLKIKDFTNLDLSNIDLSNVPMSEWEDCIFYNTNFHNTGIKFIPNKLRYIRKPGFYQTTSKGEIDISYCDFSDNDLSYLTDKDFCYEGSDNQIRTEGCNISKTGINCIRYLEDIILDESYSKIPKEYWGDLLIQVEICMKTGIKRLA